MESSSLIIWLKSMANVIVGGDSSTYFTLPAGGEEKAVLMENSDRNNNTELRLPSPPVIVKNGHVPNGMANGDLTACPSEEEQLPQSSDTESKNINNSEDDNDQPAEPTHTANGQVSSSCSHTATTTTSVPCCDIIKYKNQLCNGLRSSPVTSELKTGQTFKSSKIIEAIIDVIRNRQLFSQFDPLVTTKSHNFHISPLVTACLRNCIITGFSNIEKADSDGIIRYIGNNRFSIDCAIQIRDLRCEANYCIKLGQKWHKRICLRNKSLTLKLDKCLIYVEVKINTTTKTIRFERFSPISQQNVRCKTKPFAMGSLDQMFCKMLQRYFEKFLATNVLKVESQARRYLDRSSLLQYEDIVANTALHKLFQCFPGVVPPGAIS